MTIAMWVVWMLRADIRGTADLADPAGQRDFVCWWLSFGRAEYPAVWSSGPDQVAVAQAIEPHSGLPLLLDYLVRCRTDLARAFVRDGTIDVLGLLCWYRVAGPSELSEAPPLQPALIARTEQPCTLPPWSDHDTSVPHIAVDLWSRSPQLQTLFPATDPAARTALAAWYASAGRDMLPRTAPPAAQLPRIAAPRRRELGVNLIGYPSGELGIGEDVRMLSAALDSVHVPHAIFDVPFGPSARRTDRSVADRITTRLEHPVTIFCLTAFDTAQLHLHHGDALFAGTYRIGNWPWELPSFPAAWRDTFGLVDEIWAASRFTQQAYASAGQDTPVRLMRPAVAIGEVRRTPWRQMLHDHDAFTFLTPFDPYSSFRRKNPLASVAAFRSAFPAEDRSVALLLRVNGDPTGLPGWAELQAAIAGDPRIRVWTGTLDRAEALGVLRDVDCLVSPHRAEGYGRNIAEAKLLGVPVLATGFSGNTDFVTPAESIDWRPTPLAPGEYPFADGLWWAEPDIGHLAQRMREVRGVRTPRTTPSAVRAASARSLRRSGTAYAARLQQIIAALQPGSIQGRSLPAV